MRARGFTLLEVLVALVIVAFGMSALLQALSVSASNVSALRNKTVAEWIAMNKIADARLSLIAPSLGTTEGDLNNCGGGTWHWREDIAAVSAIPGLLSISVSVRRTGDARSNGTSASGSSSSSSTSSLTSGSLGAPPSLGLTGTLGAGSTGASSGCVSPIVPGGSLGSGAAPLGGPTSLGPSSLGGSSTLGANSSSLGSTGASGTSGPGSLGPAGALGSASSLPTGPGSLSNAITATPQGLGNQSWLVTLTGFRGNIIAAASGESPNWTGSGFAGSGGQSGIPNAPNTGQGQPSSGGTTVPGVSAPAPSTGTPLLQ